MPFIPGFRPFVRFCETWRAASSALILSALGIAFFTILAIVPTFSQTLQPEVRGENPSRNAPPQTTRFDYFVRADFFAGMAGDQARLIGP